MSQSCPHMRQIYMRSVLPCATPNCELGYTGPHLYVDKPMPPERYPFQGDPTDPSVLPNRHVRQLARYQRKYADGTVVFMWKDVTL